MPIEIKIFLLCFSIFLLQHLVLQNLRSAGRNALHVDSMPSPSLCNLLVFPQKNKCSMMFRRHLEAGNSFKADAKAH